MAEDGAVRSLARTILEASGYVVLEAADGREGLSVCQSHHGAIDLLVSDLAMPGRDGRELAERAVTLRPAMKVLFMSGDSQEDIVKGTPFLQKPFQPADLAHTVRDVLDAHAGTAE